MGLASGESLLEVSRRLGHSSITITADTYAHVSQETAQRIINTPPANRPDATPGQGRRHTPVSTVMAAPTCTEGDAPQSALPLDAQFSGQSGYKVLTLRSRSLGGHRRRG